MGNTVRVRHIHLRLGPILLAVLVVGAVAWFTADRQARQERDPAEIITETTLKQIINVSELSTFTAVYNGIAEVASGEDPEQVDYYVSYEARVDAGVDFEGVDIAVDHEAKEVTITLPEVTITQANVDIASLDFIFYNPAANTATITQEAFRACEADVEAECRRQRDIYELAEQNAENVLRALVSPILEQLDGDYVLTIR